MGGEGCVLLSCAQRSVSSEGTAVWKEEAGKAQTEEALPLCSRERKEDATEKRRSGGDEVCQSAT